MYPHRDGAEEILARRLKHLAAGLSFVAGLIGLLILVGWTLDVAVFTRGLPGFERARPKTAFSLFLGACSLWLFLRGTSGWARGLARVLAALVLFSGSISLGENIVERDSGIGQFLYEVVIWGVAGEFDERLTPTSAVALIFLGFALLLVHVRGGRNYALSSLICLPPLVLSLMALLGYGFGVRGFYEVGYYTSMAFPTALAVLALSLAVLCARPDRKPARLFVVPSLSGYWSRRLIVAVVLIPPLLSWWRLLGEQVGLYSVEFGDALLTLTTMLALAAVVMFMADKLGAVEKKLERQTRINRTIINTAPAALFVVDPEYRVTFANREVEPMFGWTEEEIVGRVLHDVLHDRHPDGRPYPAEECPLVRASLEGATLRDHEDLFFTKDKRPMYVICSSAPLVGSDRSAGSVMVIQDISQKKQAEEALYLAKTRFETLANMIPQFAWSATADGEIDYFNDRWHEYTGTSNAEDRTGTWENFLHPDDLERTRQKWGEAVATGEPFEIQHRFRRAHDGAYRWFMGRAVPIRSREGEITRWFGTSTDIEDQRRQEERLEQKVAEATAVARRQAEQVRELSIELTEAEQRERARVARVLHDDLQQILVAARMQLARLRAPDGLDTSAAENLLLQAIETSRSLSKELAPPILYEEGLGAAISRLGGSAPQQYGFEAEVQISETGPAEEEWLRIVLYEAVRELLLNAAKHSGTDHVRIALNRGGGEIEIVVEDEGKGFSPDAISGGSGSGLSFVQKRMALIGGRIGIDSAPGQGARIRLAVPVKALPALAGAAARAPV